MCGGLKITRVPFGRTSSAGLLCFLVPGGHDFFPSLQHPLVPRRPIVHLRRKGPYGSVNSECEPIVHRRAVCGSERLEVVLETIHPILLRASPAWIFPPDEFSVHRPLREAPGGLSGHGSREQKSPLSNGSFPKLCQYIPQIAENESQALSGRDSFQQIVEEKPPDNVQFQQLFQNSGYTTVTILKAVTKRDGR